MNFSDSEKFAFINQSVKWKNQWVKLTIAMSEKFSCTWHIPIILWSEKQSVFLIVIFRLIVRFSDCFPLGYMRREVLNCLHIKSETNLWYTNHTLLRKILFFPKIFLSSTFMVQMSQNAERFFHTWKYAHRSSDGRARVLCQWDNLSTLV